VGQPRILGNTVPVRASAIRSLSRTLLQATLTSSEILGFRVLRALSLFQSSSIPQASAIAQKASEASKKTLNSSYSFLRRLPFFSRLQCGRWGCLLFLVWPFLLGYFWPSLEEFLGLLLGIFLVPFMGFIRPLFGSSGPLVRGFTWPPFHYFLATFMVPPVHGFPTIARRPSILLSFWPFYVRLCPAGSMLSSAVLAR
jgi:hypothetical protein